MGQMSIRIALILLVIVMNSHVRIIGVFINPGFVIITTIVRMDLMNLAAVRSPVQIGSGPVQTMEIVSLFLRFVMEATTVPMDRTKVLHVVLLIVHFYHATMVATKPHLVENVTVR